MCYNIKTFQATVLTPVTLYVIMRKKSHFQLTLAVKFLKIFCASFHGSTGTLGTVLILLYLAFSSSGNSLHFLAITLFFSLSWSICLPSVKVVKIVIYEIFTVRFHKLLCENIIRTDFSQLLRRFRI